ncbi:hypothetical protein [Domibacillus enclensis]|uniref:Uncharacterized protein n=1 Tax=Domibacillus enclensis TaxID=1017273 RepID=A0A1N6Q0X5_9BACI|nr:hypothetical protein [Domibacillus enclensis]OXS80548.1 hypothetical protein B1B05_03445 [Domibacillus enclensis]SIQ10231.1 hypothetical protein SAMN05443094_101708 [Domibacillus enclensis]
MTKSVMMFLAFLLILPVLPWLPLGISLKGKLIIALESLAIASGIMLAVSYLPWWQGFLIGLLVFIMASYFTLKYGLPVWAADMVKIEEEYEENKTKKKRFSFSKKVEEKPERLIHTENKYEPTVQENNASLEQEQKVPRVLATEEKQDAPVQQVEQEDTGLEPLEELSWAEDQKEQQESSHQEEEIELPVLDMDLEEEDLLAHLESVGQVETIEEMDQEQSDEDSEGWIEVKKMGDEAVPTESAENEENLYLQELFEEESAALDQMEAPPKEESGVENEELTLLELDEVLQEEKDEKDDLETDYLADLFEDEPETAVVDENVKDKVHLEVEDDDILPVLLEWKKELPEEDLKIAEDNLLEEIELDNSASPEEAVQLELKEEADPATHLHKQTASEEPSEFSTEETDHNEPDSLVEAVPERPFLSAEWLHIIRQEIAVKQQALPYQQVEDLMLKYLNAPLHDRDYYTIARMLVAFYAANGETLQAMLFTDVLKERLQKHPALVEEIESMKEFIIKQSMETGE